MADGLSREQGIVAEMKPANRDRHRISDVGRFRDLGEIQLQLHRQLHLMFRVNLVWRLRAINVTKSRLFIACSAQEFSSQILVVRRG